MMPSAPKMSPDTVTFSVSYDRKADVLYISTRSEDEVGARFDRRNGILWRYDGNGNVIGMTIMEFRERLPLDRSLLEKKVAEKFHLPAFQASNVLDHALSADRDIH